MKSIHSTNRVIVGLIALLAAATLTACGPTTLTDEGLGCETGEKKLTFGFFSTHAMPDVTLSRAEYDGLDFLLEAGARGNTPDYSGIKLAGTFLGDGTASSTMPVYRQMQTTPYNEAVLCLDSTQPVTLFVRGSVAIVAGFGADSGMLTYDRIECDINEPGPVQADGTLGETKNLVTAHRELSGTDYLDHPLLGGDVFHIGVQCVYTYIPVGWTGPTPASYGSLAEETGGMVS